MDLICPNCNKNTYTVVKVEMPTLSIWNRLCCVGDLVNSCYSPRDW